VTSRVPGEPYPDLLKEKGGRGFPTLRFLDSKGNVIGEPKGRSVADFEAALKEAAAKMPPPKPGKYAGPKIWTWEEALKEGKKSNKMVLLVLQGDDKATEEITKILYSEKVKKNVEPFLVVEHAFGKDDDLCKKLCVKEGPHLLAIDPRKDKAEESVLEIYAGKCAQGAIVEFLKKWEKGPDKDRK
jgi:hypothetical protein